MWTQIVRLNSFSAVRNATPKFSITHYAHTPLRTLSCAHSSSIHRLHLNNKPGLCDHSRSGFSNSLKRMTKSASRSRQHCILDGVRCGNAAEDTDCVVDDEFYMRRSLEIARKAIGHTSPNPMVGCVIVNNGKIVGEGFHPKAGQPHAEVFALREAGDLAENATAYVTLEPCNHYGRTPPCTEALIKAKVKRVVIGMVDPNPIVSSKGVHRLKEAGIDVTSRILENSCKKLNEAYIHQMLTGKPLLTLRYSLSVNGCFLDQVGAGVTDIGGYFSQLLQEYDVVLISPTTSSEKFEIPASKENGSKQPLWIILPSPDGFINIPHITEETTKVIILTDKEAVAEQNTTQGSIETVVLDELNLANILDYCTRQGLCSVLWDLRANFDIHEGLLKEGIEQKLLQKVVVEVLPIWNESQSENSQPLIKRVTESLKLKDLQSRISGQSVILEGYF